MGNSQSRGSSWNDWESSQKAEWRALVDREITETQWVSGDDYLIMVKREEFLCEKAKLMKRFKDEWIGWTGGPKSDYFWGDDVFQGRRRRQWGSNFYADGHDQGRTRYRY